MHWGFVFSCSVVLASAAATNDSVSLLQSRATMIQENDEGHQATTTQEPCAGQIICGDSPDSIGDTWASTYTYPIGPKRKFGPDGTWATPYCKDVRGCEAIYCPNGCKGAAMWENSPYDNTRLDYVASERKFSHYLLCSHGMEGINMGRAHKPGTTAMGGWLDCRNSENATKKPYWSETDNADLVKEMMQTKPNGRGGYWPTQNTEGSGTMNMGHEFCPAGCVNDCVAFKWGNVNHCGFSRTGGTNGWGGYNGAATNANGPWEKCPSGSVYNDNGYYSQTWCGEKQPAGAATDSTDCKCVTTTTTTTPPTCGSVKIQAGQCCFNDVPNGLFEGVTWEGGCDDSAEMQPSVPADNAEDCAAKLAPMAGTDDCPNPNMFQFNGQYKICQCLLRPSRTDCDYSRWADQPWATYSFAGCTIPPPQPWATGLLTAEPRPPPPKGQCGDKLGNKCNHMPGNVYADMPRHGGGFCGGKKCSLQECAERVAAKAGTDVCPNPNIFIYSEQYNICKCQYKQRGSLTEGGLAGFCDRDGSSTGAGQYTYNLAGGKGGLCGGTTTTTTTTTTTQAPCAGQIICGDVKPIGKASAYNGDQFTYPIGPKRKFGPDGTWATPYCKDVRGCETVYCPNGCGGAAMWERPLTVNTRIDYNPADNTKYAHYLYCSESMRGINMNSASKPGTNVAVSNAWVDCRNSENATKPRYWSETDNADLVNQIMQAKPNDHVTNDRGSMNMGYEFCPDGIVNDCCAFKWGNLNHCGATGNSWGWGGYDGGKTFEVGPNKNCWGDEVHSYTGYYSEVWCGEPQPATDSTDCKCVTTTTTTTAELCIGGVQAGDGFSRDKNIGGASSLEECVSLCKTAEPDSNAAVMFKGLCRCEYESCGIGNPTGGWDSAQLCLFKEVSVDPLDASGCSGGWVAGASSHGGRIGATGNAEFGVPMGTAGSAEECLAIVKAQKGDVANGVTYLASQSKCQANMNQSTFMPPVSKAPGGGGLEFPGGWESATSCFFGYWCGWGALQQAGPTAATTTTTTDPSAPAWTCNQKSAIGVCLDGLDETETETEITDENENVRECKKWCYSKKHANKPWEGRKCQWYACAACPECATATTTSAAATGITISDATYGYNNCGDQGSDETENLGQACNGKSSCTYCVDAAVIGDPAGGCSKEYHYTFACPGPDEDLLGQRKVGMLVSEASGKCLTVECPTKSQAEILAQSIVLGDMGGNDCPDGSEDFTEAECKELGTVDFGSTGRTNNVDWANPGYTGTGTFQGANTWNNIPNGCTTIPDSPKHEPWAYYYNRAAQGADYNNPVGYQFKLCKGGFVTTTTTTDPSAPSWTCDKKSDIGVCLDGLDEIETPEEITCEVEDRRECKGWCYSKKHKNKPWKTRKCEWYACAACPECATPVPTPAPTPGKMCRKSCHRGEYIKKKACQRDKCADCCECTGECEPKRRPPRPQKCLDKCYRKTKGNREVRNKNDMKKHMCHKNKCGACPECQPSPVPSATCDGSCYTAKGALDPSKQCGKQKCGGCAECTSASLFLEDEDDDDDDADDDDDDGDEDDDDAAAADDADLMEKLREVVKEEEHLREVVKSITDHVPAAGLATRKLHHHHHHQH